MKTFRKSDEKIQVPLKSDKNKLHDHISLNSS